MRKRGEQCVSRLRQQYHHPIIRTKKCSKRAKGALVTQEDSVFVAQRKRAIATALPFTPPPSVGTSDCWRYNIQQRRHCVLLLSRCSFLKMLRSCSARGLRQLLPSCSSANLFRHRYTQPQPLASSGSLQNNVRDAVASSRRFFRSPLQRSESPPSIGEFPHRLSRTSITHQNQLRPGSSGGCRSGPYHVSTASEITCIVLSCCEEIFEIMSIAE